LKIITVVGARPQFIKAAAVSRAILEHNAGSNNLITESILHTGQHYDEKMSAVFFDQLEIPNPKYNLGIIEKNHGAMTGKMLEQIEMILLDERPDMLLVYGDTNSTLAGTLAAAKLHIPVAHVEAGLRSYNRSMPEEINRVMTDHLSSFLFCPTQAAVQNLNGEGIEQHIHNVGDVMYDVAMKYRSIADRRYQLEQWQVEENSYILCTVHRAENSDQKARLQSIFYALNEVAAEIPVVLPLHPRTRKMLKEFNLEYLLDPLHIIEPVSYLEMVRLEMSAKAIITDSGGIQKEAFFHKVPCLTLRDETEWVETVELGCNKICGANKDVILEKWIEICRDNDMFYFLKEGRGLPYGNGTASYKIVEVLTANDC